MQHEGAVYLDVRRCDRRGTAEDLASLSAARVSLRRVEAFAEQSVSPTLPGTDGDDELRGRQLGDFVLRECIGAGGFAAVYRCEQPMLGREAVIKILHNRLRSSDVVLQRFLREARLASRLDHPYAAHVYAFGVEEEDGLAWIAMEFVHGTSLEQWLVERGPLPLEMLVTFFEQVADVVQNAHDHGIVHRDLKPSNVMLVERAGKVFPKLLDFGIAKLVDEAALGASGIAVEVGSDLSQADTLFPSLSDSGGNLTQANATLGSPPYMSPEQWRDPLSVGPRSDLYSLAVMAYEALTGKQPYTGPTIASIAEQHCCAPVPSVGPGFPPSLDRVFQRALAKEPADRPATAVAFAGELRAAANAQHTDPSITPPESIIAVRPKRKLWPLAVGGAALVAGGIAAYTLMAGAGGAQKSPPPPAVVAGPVEPVAPAPTPAPAPVAPPPVQAPEAHSVVVQIESTPPGADVFRLPSETRVGATPWRAELPREAGTQRFVIKKSGYADKRVEVDLRTGGTQTVKLAKSARRSGAGAGAGTPAAAAPAGGSGPVRRKGEPVDPFAPKKP
jgi:serine/threonine protein kinase